MISFKPVDFILLEALQEDSTQSLRELEKILEIPRSTIHSKIQKFRNNGVIEKESISINLKLLNLPMLAFIMLTFDQRMTSLNQEEVAENLAKLPQVMEVHLLAGEWDILLKVRTQNINSLGDFSIKSLKSVEGVGKSLTYVVLKQIKENQPVLISELSK